MEKWEQKLKDDVNRSVPSMIDERVEETLKQLPRKKAKRKIYTGLSVVAAALSLTFGLSFFSPAFANTMKEIPIIGSAFEFVGNIGLIKGKNEGLTTELGEQVELDGQLITFTETLYDGGEIHIGYIREVIDHNQGTDFINNLQFTIDGKYLGSYGMGGHEEEIEKGIYAGAISISVREGIPDSFALGISPREGKSWSVKLPVEKKGNHQSFLVNRVEKTEDLTILYDQITFFPTSTEISLRLSIDEKAYTEEKYMMLDFIVMDDKGRVLQPFSSGGGGGGPVKGKVLHRFKYYYEPMQMIPRSLTIKPYLTEINETSPKIERIRWEGEKITLSQGKIGNVTILERTENNGITTFTFEVEGEDLYNQANTLWLENADRTRYYPDQPAERVEGTVNQYNLSFKDIPDTNELYITTTTMNPPHYLKDLEVTINLK